MTVVAAQQEDVEALARVHVQAWRESYAGLIPDAVLAALDPIERAGMWARIIGAGECVLLARDAAGALLGFIAAGPQRESDLPFAGEIGALYLLDAAKRRGLGRALMRAAATYMLARGMGSASLWVLDGNLPAIAFYAALGGRVVANRALPARRAWVGRETAYAWDDLRRLIPNFEIKDR